MHHPIYGVLALFLSTPLHYKAHFAINDQLSIHTCVLFRSLVPVTPVRTAEVVLAPLVWTRGTALQHTAEAMGSAKKALAPQERLRASTYIH